MFPLKANYEQYRNFPISQLPSCILRPAEPDDCDVFAEKEDSEDTSDAHVASSGTQGPSLDDHGDKFVMPDLFEEGPIPRIESDPKDPKTEPDEEGYTYRQDRIGRWYKYDKHGNRVYSKPLHGTLKPPSIPKEAWRALQKKDKVEVHRKWRELEDGKSRAEAEVERLRKANAAMSGSSSAGLSNPKDLGTPDLKVPGGSKL